MNDQQQLTKKQRREMRKQEKQQQREKEARKKTTNRIIMWVVIVLLLGGLVYGLTLLGGSDGDTDRPILVDAVSDTDNTKGAENDVVTLIEYSDFQCPACASYYTMVNDLAEEYSDTLTIAYRHFPLRSIHPNAQDAGEAAEAAALQGKFWEMHDKLFANQSEWSDEGNPDSIFVEYAGELGLDTAQFETDLASDAVEEEVNADYRSATAASVNATPTFFLNGEKIDNPRSLADFRSLIDAEIAASDTVPTDEETNDTANVETDSDVENANTTE